MHILTVVYSEVTQPSGIHTVIRRVLAELAGAGHTCTVLSANPEHLAPMESVDGFNIVRVNSSLSRFLYGWNPELLRRLDLFFKGNTMPDIVHIHGYHSLLTPSALRVASISDLPVVFSPYYSAHNTILGRSLSIPYGIATKGMFRHPDITICASAAEAADIQRKLGILPRKTVIVPLGVDSVPQEPTYRPPKTGSRLLLLYVGWLLKYKGVQYVLRALEDLRAIYHLDAELRIVGDGPYKQRLKKMAMRLGVDGRITWTSPLPESDLPPVYAQSDFLLLLSRSEAYGLVVAEALAAGTPCIVSTESALNEFAGEPGCFGVDDPSDSAAVASTLTRLARRRIQVGPFSSKIQTWREVARSYEGVYRNLLEGA